MRRTLLSLFLIMLCFAQAGLCHPMVPMVTEKTIGSKSYIVGSVSVKAPRELVWKALNDYDGATSLFENLRECKVLKDSGETKLVKQVVKTGFVNLEYQIVSTHKIDTIEFRSVKGRFQKFDGYWHIEPKSENLTVVSYGLHVIGTSIFPTSFLRSRFRKYTPELLTDLRTKLEKRRPESKLF